MSQAAGAPTLASRSPEKRAIHLYVTVEVDVRKVTVINRSEYSPGSVFSAQCLTK